MTTAAFHKAAELRDAWLFATTEDLFNQGFSCEQVAEKLRSLGASESEVELAVYSQIQLCL